MEAGFFFIDGLGKRGHSLLALSSLPLWPPGCMGTFYPVSSVSRYRHQDRAAAIEGPMTVATLPHLHAFLPITLQPQMMLPSPCPCPGMPLQDPSGMARAAKGSTGATSSLPWQPLAFPMPKLNQHTDQVRPLSTYHGLAVQLGEPLNSLPYEQDVSDFTHDFTGKGGGQAGHPTPSELFELVVVAIAANKGWGLKWSG